jgi:hypothetical protein
MYYTLSVTATIEINDANLTFSVTNGQSTQGPDGLHFDPSVVSNEVGAREQRIQTEINSIKASQSLVATVQGHLTALNQMIATLRAWKPSSNSA